jgi:Competence protein CoiA-like family
VGSPQTSCPATCSQAGPDTAYGAGVCHRTACPFDALLSRWFGPAVTPGAHHREMRQAGWKRRPQTSALLGQGGELVHLPRGAARAFRDRKAQGQQYLCPVCDEAFHTVRGGTIRDHFAHAPGFRASASHAMSAAHFDAQVQLLQRARAQGLEAWLEKPIEDNVRRADVMVRMPDQRRIVLEVQYSGLTVELWQQRHRDYRDRGIVDVWLWHLDPDDIERRPWPSGGEILLLAARTSRVQEAAIQAGLAALWILPEGRITTGISGVPFDPKQRAGWLDLNEPRHRAALGLQSSRTRVERDPHGWLDLSGLDECRLTPDGLRTPALDRIDADREYVERFAASRPIWERVGEPNWLIEQNDVKDHALASQRTEQVRANVQRLLSPEIYRYIEAAHPSDEDIHVTGAQLRAWVMTHIASSHRRRWPIVANDLKHSCHKLGILEARRWAISTAVDAFLYRLSELRIVTVGRIDQVIRPGTAFKAWEPRLRSLDW